MLCMTCTVWMDDGGVKGLACAVRMLWVVW